METFLPLLIILFLVILPLLARRKRAAAVRQFLNRKKQNKESNEMSLDACMISFEPFPGEF